MELIFKEKIDSTNTYGKENIETLADKSVVYAAYQTDGRGRMNRKWMSFNSENLYASIILKPQGDYSKLPTANLTQLLSVVIVEVLNFYGIKSYIKWPNDVVVMKDENDIFGEKICGILAEVASVSNNIKGIVLGFGLNINATKEELSRIDRPATSMFNETGSLFNTKEVLENICEMYFSKYDEFLDKGFNLIKDDYLSKIKFIGKEITINMPHKSVTGIAKNITEQGAVLLENKDSLTEITIGEIL
ncbi:biotin--[bacterium]|nr:biotin--[acetyl-CoA-carboxylase] ligase [bacterium]